MGFEQIKSIEGYDGKYLVSSSGKVYSTERYVNNHTGLIHKPQRELAQTKDAKGYVRVFLDEKGKTKFIPVHRLVALAFIENPNHKPQVNHIDGNKMNNSVSNLEWVTNTENQRHAVRLKLNDHSKYEAGRPKRKVLQIDTKTGEVIKIHNSIAEAGRSLGISYTSNIGACCRGKRNIVKGYKWKYA